MPVEPYETDALLLKHATDDVNKALSDRLSGIRDLAKKKEWKDSAMALPNTFCTKTMNKQQVNVV